MNMEVTDGETTRSRRVGRRLARGMALVLMLVTSIGCGDRTINVQVPPAAPAAGLPPTAGPTTTAVAPAAAAPTGTVTATAVSPPGGVVTALLPVVIQIPGVAIRTGTDAWAAGAAGFDPLGQAVSSAAATGQTTSSRGAGPSGTTTR
jgi:hypothetical protein